VIHSAGRVVGRFFDVFDVLLTPTMASPPHKLGVLSPSNPDTDAYIEAVNRSIGFTALFNASGHPAASLPLHWTPDGLPVGVQQIEAAAPWDGRRAPHAA